MNLRSLVLLTTCLMIAGIQARANPPSIIPLQGILTDPAGEPLEGDFQTEFSIFDSVTGGIPLWTETQWILVERGMFSTYLGAATQLGLELFRDHSELWLEIKVGEDTEMPRVFLGTTPYSGYSEYTANDSLSMLDCADSQVAKFNGTEWFCADDEDTDDTLSGLSCLSGQTAKWDGNEWTCAADVDTDTQLTETEVDDYVSNNGFIVNCAIDYSDCEAPVPGTSCYGVGDVEHCCSTGYVVVGVDNASVSRVTCCRLSCN